MSANVDWPQLLDDIAYLLGDPIPGNPHLHVALGTPRLAEYLGITRGKLRNVLEGTKVEYDEGTAWIALWCRLTSKSASFVPRVQRPMSTAKFFTAKSNPDLDARALTDLPWGRGRVARKLGDEALKSIGSSAETLPTLAKMHGVSPSLVSKVRKNAGAVRTPCQKHAPTLRKGCPHCFPRGHAGMA